MSCLVLERRGEKREVAVCLYGRREGDIYDPIKCLNS